jgi:hypothetical protein
MKTKDIGHTRTRSLPPELAEQVIALRQSGASDEECGRFIQKQGKWLDIQPRSAAQAIRRYFDANPSLAVTKDPVMAKAIDLYHDGEPPRYITKYRDAVEDHIDVLTEMETLYGVQRGRVLEYREKEKGGKSVGTDVRAEIKVALKMLVDIGALQMDINVLERVPTRLDARVAKMEQFDIGRHLLELSKEDPKLAKELAGLLQSPEAMKEMLRGELIDD